MTTEAQITAWIASQQQAMIDLLRQTVDIDSGSYNKAGIDAVGAAIEAFLADAEAILREEQMPVLPLTLAHALAAGALDWAHRDPFDRMLAAQALAEGATLVTADRVFATVAPASGLALMAA